MQHQTSFFVATVLLAFGTACVLCCKLQDISRVVDGDDTSSAQAFRALTTCCRVISAKAFVITIKGDLPVTSSHLKARLGATAALIAMLLTAFVSQSHAAVSVQENDLQVVGSLPESARNDLDSSCTPPSGLAACAAWHKAIRSNFSPREIGILFGTATSYPEYATAYARIKNRYARLHDEFSAYRLPARAVSVK